MSDLKDFEFGNIITENQDIKEIRECFIQAHQKNKTHFSSNIKDLKIHVVETEEEFKEKLGNHHVDWATGMAVQGNKIVLKNKELAKGGDDFYKVFSLHEMNHAFWYQNYNTWKPRWLMEGFACHISDDFMMDTENLRKLIIQFKVNSSMVDYTSIRKRLKGHYPKYPLWANFTRFIAKKFGENKIKEFMEEYSKRPVRKNYDKTFMKHFGTNDTKLFNEFVENIRSKKLDEF